MKMTVHIVRKGPDSVESIELEDVAMYEMTDSSLTVHFNKSNPSVYSLVLDPNTPGEWFYVNISITRVGLRINMTQ